MAQPTIHWTNLENGKLLLTGGTGFIGRWILQTLCWAEDHLALGLRITVPSRNPSVFCSRFPYLARHPCLTLLAADLTRQPLQGCYSHIIHGATETNAKLNAANPLNTFQTIVEGTRGVLELARHSGGKVLNLSSGAVYGAQPFSTTQIAETWLGGPDPQLAQNAYGEAKRAAETLCAIYRQQFATNNVSARIFSLLGPGLPLDQHFAAGNFISDALQNKEILILGDGRTQRSYLYAADLVVWLLTLLTRPNQATAYNVGSEHAISIASLANEVSKVIGSRGVAILGANDKGWNPGPYVPDTALIREEFGLTETTPLSIAILNTARASLNR
jgi:dTDP-glucose 4,6-dehydratase